MFFNSLNKRLKKTYATLNPEGKKMVFPNGENEFIYVGTLLNGMFENRELLHVIQVYASVCTYFKLQMGNCYITYIYAKKKMSDYSDEDIYNMLAIVMMNTAVNKDFSRNPIEQIDMYKKAVKLQIEKVEVIEKNKEIFGTKDSEIAGTIDNPLLLAGIKGLHQYFDNIVTEEQKEIIYERSSSIYLTESNTGVEYALDEYVIKDKETNQEIVKVWVNLYGKENTEVCLQKFIKKQ